MTQRETDIVERFKAWSFPVLISVLSFFGVQTMRKIDVVVEELKNLNTAVRKIEVIQDYQGKQLDKQDTRIDIIERDNTRYNAK